jgi:phosphoserine phosphatase
MTSNADSISFRIAARARSGAAARAVAPEPPAVELLQSLDRLRGHEGTALVDLDETLYLRNSTEDFLDSVRPALLGLLVLRVLDVLRPWALTGGEATRDVWRVQVVAVLFPWTLLVWRRRVRGLAARHRNRPLAEVLREREGPTAIVTNGFRFIVQPLVAALGAGTPPIVASRLFSYADRRDGKLALALGALGEARVAKSLVLTDSEQDRPLLDRCACPLLVVWPDAAYVRAFSRTYLPGQYISQVKRPGERYILRGIVQEDFAFWVLASLPLARLPVLHFAGLALLLVSFWTIYECGYVDNDRVAERHELDPKLSHAFHHSPVATPPVQPWVWAVATGTLGVYALGWPGPFSSVRLLTWLAILVATLLWFRLYNRFSKGTRAWLYLPLQLARSVAFVPLVAVSTLGVAALGAHALSRWVHYYIYRLGGVGTVWPRAQSELMRLAFFLVFAGLLALAQGPATVVTWTALALLAWNLFRARSELGAVVRSASRVDR